MNSPSTRRSIALLVAGIASAFGVSVHAADSASVLPAFTFPDTEPARFVEPPLNNYKPVTTTNTGWVVLEADQRVRLSRYTNAPGAVFEVDGGIARPFPNFKNSGLLIGHGDFQYVAVQGEKGSLVVATGGTLEIGSVASLGTLASARDGQLGIYGGYTENLLLDGDLNFFRVGNRETGLAGYLYVFGDYVSAKWGEGNSFYPRTGVTGPANIEAPYNTAIALGGDAAGGSIDFGTVRVGETVRRTFTVGNYGLAGQVRLRGALQTVAQGWITDERLSGSGVTPQNFGPLLRGESVEFEVVFTASAPGSLTDQRISLVPNFGNVPVVVVPIRGVAVD